MNIRKSCPGLFLVATGQNVSVVSRGFALFGLVITVVGGGLAVRAAVLELKAGVSAGTNAVRTSQLASDFEVALNEIDNGIPRPNVRNPKTFSNDGRGGTSRLPDTDASGKSVTYTEHTVNPRPPGGNLDAKRIITGSDGSVWATSDHFVNWVRIR